MQVSNVTQQDAVACAQLIRALQAARFDGLSGKDIEAYIVSQKWLGELGLQIAKLLPGPHQAALVKPKEEPKAGDQTMRIKAMGPIGGKPMSKRKKK